jgi:hypothetical protein
MVAAELWPQMDVCCDPGAARTRLDLAATSSELEQNDNSVAWGVATISAGTHLIPTSFSFSATDLTAGGTVVFSDTQAKGKGNGLSNRGPVFTCSTPSFVDTAGDLGIPNVPPGDVILVQMSATAILAG